MRRAPEPWREPLRLPVGAQAPGALPGMLHDADGGTAARALLALQRERGNAVASRLVGAVLAREPAAPATAEPATTEAPEAPEGIGDSESLARYVAQARTILEDWDKYDSAVARARALLSAVNAEILASGGVPVRDIRVRPLDTEGEFDKTTWTAAINEPLFSGPRPGGGWAYRAAVIAHEARHCEQAFLAARLMAGRGRSWFGIVKELQIPEDVAKAARERPLERDDPQAEEAAVFLRSMTGFGAIREAKVMERLTAAKDEYREALLAYERGEPADKPALRAAVDAAYAKVQEAEAAYRALPGEADAFELSDDVMRAFRDTPP